MDAGADTSTAVRITNRERGMVVFNNTPLSLAEYFLREKKIGVEDATQSQLHSLETMRRLVADEGGGCPCGLLALGNGHVLDHPCCYCCCGEYKQDYQEGIDPADSDVAGLKAKDWKAQGALGCPVQVGSDIMPEVGVPLGCCWWRVVLCGKCFMPGVGVSMWHCQLLYLMFLSVFEFELRHLCVSEHGCLLGSPCTVSIC